MFSLNNGVYYAVTGLIYEAAASMDSRTLFYNMDGEHFLEIQVSVNEDDSTSLEAGIAYNDGHVEGFYSSSDISDCWSRIGQFISDFRTACFTKLIESYDLPY